MAEVVVVGAGIGGLATALALGRGGHHVTVLERDVVPAAADAEEAFAAERRGAPQARQSHGFLARLVLELRQRFPDVHRALLDAGSTPMSLATAFDDRVEGDDDLAVLAMRRTTVEWVLRRTVDAEPTVTVRAGVGVAGLQVEAVHGSPPPVVTGVALEDGAAVPADAVVLATGRRGPVPAWLADAGVDVEEALHESGLVYLTRWYRTPGGVEVPPQARLAGDHGFVKYLAIPGDADTFSVTLAVQVADAELRSLLSDPEPFDATARMLEGPRTLLDQGDATPLTDVLPMGGLVNRLRRFVDASGEPVVLGLHVVGDAHTCTNPLYGRGCSLAVVQAGALADAFAAHPGDPAGRARAYEATCAREVEPWFTLAVQADAMGADPSGAAIRATGAHRTGTPADDAHRTIARVFAAGGRDPVVGRGLMRMMNLLATPSDLLADPAFLARAMEIASDPERYPAPPAPEGPSRDEVLATLVAPAP